MAADAFADIINNERFVGAINEIQWLTTIMDNIFIQIISVIGFLIISMSLIKNCLAGAYAAFPKMFDAVDEIKAEWSQGNGRFGLAQRVLAFFIPNIKSLTDFSDGTRSVRGYFTTALIQCVVTVLIGVLIYNGVYRDLVAEGAKVGQHFITNFVLAHDYSQMLDNLMGAGKNYAFSKGNVEGDVGARKDQINKSVYDRVKQAWPGTVSTLTTDMLQTIGVRTENVMEGHYRAEAGGRQLAEYFGDQSYTVTSGIDLHSSVDFLNEDTYPIGGLWTPDNMGGGTYTFSALIGQLGAGEGQNSAWVKDGKDHTMYRVYGAIIINQRSTNVGSTAGMTYFATVSVGAPEPVTRNNRPGFAWNLASMDIHSDGYRFMSMNQPVTAKYTTTDGEQITAQLLYTAGSGNTPGTLALFFENEEARNIFANNSKLFGNAWALGGGGSTLQYGTTGEMRVVSTVTFQSAGNGNNSAVTGITFRDNAGLLSEFVYGQKPTPKSGGNSQSESSAAE